MRLIGFCCACLLLPRLGWSAVDRDLIQPFPHGTMNWSIGLLSLSYTAEDASLQDEDPVAEAHLHEQIIRRLFQSLVHVRVDAKRCLGDLVEADAELRGKLIKIVQSAPLYYHRRLPDNRVEVGIRIQINGGVSQIMLPAEIKQIETIHAVGKGTAVQPSSSGGGEATQAYTGLVVDARGTHAQPALVPVLVDENNDELYGAAFVSRDFAVRQGLCGYARKMGEAEHMRVGSNPLMIKALHAAAEGRSRIVISNPDASKLRAASNHLAFLKQCRVVILLD